MYPPRINDIINIIVITRVSPVEVMARPPTDVVHSRKPTAAVVRVRVFTLCRVYALNDDVIVSRNVYTVVI